MRICSQCQESYDPYDRLAVYGWCPTCVLGTHPRLAELVRAEMAPKMRQRKQNTLNWGSEWERTQKP